MPNIRANCEAIENLTACIKAHWLCARFFDEPACYLALLPPGYRVDGMQALKGMGKVAALTQLLAALNRYGERHWSEQ